MKQFARSCMGIAVAAVILTGAAADPAIAQDKGAATKAVAAKKGEPVSKTLIDNDKVRVYTSTFKPGDVSPNRARVQRVVHYMNAGTLQRTYPDGKTEDRKFKAGDVVWIEASTYSVKNVGKTPVTLYGMEVKSK
jgi:hypothetical protein